MRSLGVLIVRLVVGGLLAGHGAQKLFGWFGGAGLEGTAGWMESMRLRPGTAWARLAGGSELGGGLLTALGFLNPLGPIAAMGAMSMAWAKVHLGNPVWSTKGGAELPLTNIAVLSALTLAGPGRLSLDSLFGIRVPRRVALAALAGMLGCRVRRRPAGDRGGHGQGERGWRRASARRPAGTRAEGPRHARRGDWLVHDPRVRWRRGIGRSGADAGTSDGRRLGPRLGDARAV